jgi:hypothetical protein
MGLVNLKLISTFIVFYQAIVNPDNLGLAIKIPAPGETAG